MHRLGCDHAPGQARQPRGLVQDLLQHYELEAYGRGLRLRTIVRDEQTWALCAPDKVERVLTNLVTNALRYTPSGGLVTASVTSGAGAVFVSLEDSGPGVAEDQRERIFEPFWRGDTARRPPSAERDSAWRSPGG